MVNNKTLEVCIANVEDGIKADKYPIDRLELNSGLELGGLSPSVETLKYLKERVKAKVCVMCRPRGGDFYYNETEYQIMLKEAEMMLKNNADGIVFGFLKADKTIDVERTKAMCDLIHTFGKEAIFHKAYDETADLDEATRILIDCQVDRVLTSGKAASSEILKGCEVVNSIREKYGDKIQILPGGGVRVENIQDVLKISGCDQVHMSSKQQNPGGYAELDETQLQQLIEKVAAL